MDIIGLYSTTVTYLASKTIEFGEKCKIRAFTPFKVIQGHPPFGGCLGTMYDIHLGLIGKCIMDFLLLIIELFSLDDMAEAIRAKIDRKSAILLQRGQFDPKFQVEGYVPHQSFLHGYLDQ